MGVGTLARRPGLRAPTACDPPPDRVWAAPGGGQTACRMAHAPVATDPGATTNGRAPTAPRGRLLAGDDAVPRGLAVSSAIALRLLILAGAIYFVGKAAGGLLLLVLPVVIALLLTTLLRPPANWLRRHHFRP